MAWKEREWVAFDVLEGQTITEIENKDDAELIFTTAEGNQYLMYHQQDCCEDVWLDDSDGLDDIIGQVVRRATESSQDIEDIDHNYGTGTWTFYSIITDKSIANLVWRGESNGYYSESVDFMKCVEGECKWL